MDHEPALTELTETQRAEAMKRFAVLAENAGVPLRTVQRWLSRYSAAGLRGLARAPRADIGRRKVKAEIVAFIEGLFLRKPRPSVAFIHRRVLALATERQWSPPSYGSIHAIIQQLDPSMVMLAHEGHAAYRDHFELIFRHRAELPNMMWQADHTQLDLLILDAGGKPARPWLTTVLDDHSRALAGYLAFLGAPSALQTSLALRQAIWRKADPAWPVCGIPDVLYVDHGSDFTSHHLEQVAVALKIQLVYSTVARPQGRGKVERLFGTVNTELLPELPGYLVHGKPVTPPRLSLSELDAALGVYFIGQYNVRVHGEIDSTPQAAWLGQGWLPRMPESLEELDLLLVTLAEARTVRRDGIHFQGLRYMDSTLAAYVGEPVTIRYDPRDMAEIRVFHRNRFLCRAISSAHSGQTITLKDIQTARTTHRRALRGQINERIAQVTDFLPPSVADPAPPPIETSMAAPSRASRLRTYREDLE
jgi:putative transposase